MIALDLLDAGLALLVVAVATWTIVARGNFAAVVGFVTYGLLLSLVWVRIAALDVAITEAAIGSGVTGLLLIGAAVRLRHLEGTDRSEQVGGLGRLGAAVLSLLVAAALAAVFLSAEGQGPSLAPEAARHLSQFGLGNPITAVLMAYRAVDTMLEKVVLILAVIGVWSLAPDTAWGGAPARLSSLEPDPALVFLARVLPPFGIVIAIYIAWVGASEPGGAFQGGALLAAMALIVLLARLADAPEISRLWLRLVIVSGPITFLAVGLLGFAVATGFMAYPPAYAKALILFIEAFMVLSIAAMLPLLVLGPPKIAPGFRGRQP